MQATYVIFSLPATTFLKKQNETGKINFHNIYYVSISKCFSFQHVINIETINELFYIFGTKSLKYDVCFKLTLHLNSDTLFS